MFRIEDLGPIRRLTIDNPVRKNAIPPEGWAQLATALEDFAASDRRALVMTGAEGNFCSGASLDSTTQSTATVIDRYAMMSQVGRAASALHRLGKPTVAAVEGVAVGAGMNLALGCDVVLATPDARFAEIFVKRGLTVDFGGTWLLPRLVGLARAKELALTGRIISGEEAAELGLVSRTVPSGEIMAAALDLAAELAAGAPLAQRFIKAGLERSMEMSWEEALAYEGQAQAICISSEDAAEGVAAFLDKRRPEFTGS